MSSSVLNKKASFKYNLGDRLEAGISLTGGEVKSVRAGSVRLDDSYVRIANNEVFVVNLFIAPYKFALDPSYDPKRERKLLLNRQEIETLVGKTSARNLTIVPTKIYTTHNLVKLEIALGIPKKKADKRDTLKKKALERETQRVLREDKLKDR